jgi:hypothetical protein
MEGIEDDALKLFDSYGASAGGFQRTGERMFRGLWQKTELLGRGWVRFVFSRKARAGLGSSENTRKLLKLRCCQNRIFSSPGVMVAPSYMVRFDKLPQANVDHGVWIKSAISRCVRRALERSSKSGSVRARRFLGTLVPGYRYGSELPVIDLIDCASHSSKRQLPIDVALV